MLTIIIFSKDRPIQLDLAIKSIKKNIQIESDIKVIYGFSNLDFLRAYERLACEYTDIQFLDDQANDFGWCVMNIAEKAREFIMFFPDDNIFYKKSTTTDLDLSKLFADSSIAALSLRLGRNIAGMRFSYKQSEITRIFGVHEVYHRMEYPANSYWANPLSLDGHIFKKSVISPIIKDIYKQKMLTHPNELEKMLLRYFFEMPPFIAVEFHSCVVNSPNNRVQELVKNWFGRLFPVGKDELLVEFIRGKRVSLEKLQFDVSNVYQEINILEGLE